MTYHNDPFYSSPTQPLSSTNTTHTPPFPCYPYYNPSYYSTYTPSPSYYNSYGSTNSEYSAYYHNSNYPVSLSSQVFNRTTFYPLATTYSLLQKHEIAFHVTETEIPIFDGTSDGYWWILCIEKYFKSRRTPEAAKVTEAVTALQGSALQWWIDRQCHSKVSWECFTVIFLWQFKPEYRDILPLLEDGKEEINNNESLGPFSTSFSATVSTKPPAKPTPPISDLTPTPSPKPPTSITIPLPSPPPATPEEAKPEKEEDQRDDELFLPLTLAELELHAAEMFWGEEPPPAGETPFEPHPPPEPPDPFLTIVFSPPSPPPEPPDSEPHLMAVQGEYFIIDGALQCYREHPTPLFASFGLEVYNHTKLEPFDHIILDAIQSQPCDKSLICVLRKVPLLSCHVSHQKSQEATSKPFSTNSENLCQLPHISKVKNQPQNHTGPQKRQPMCQVLFASMYLQFFMQPSTTFFYPQPVLPFQNFSHASPHYLAIRPCSHSSCVTFEPSKSTEAYFKVAIIDNALECLSNIAKRSSIKEWDPGGKFLVFKVVNCSQLKQWDPGKKKSAQVLEP